MANPKFEHRHYKEIAALIADTAETVTRQQLAERFASFFASDNHRFDCGRFLDAARGQPRTKKDKPRA